MSYSSQKHFSNGHSAVHNEAEAGPSKQPHHLHESTTSSTLAGERAASDAGSYDYDGIDSFQAIQQEHDAAIVSHVYQKGFQKGEYADVQLNVLQRSYRLHCLILARSPYLKHLIDNSHTKIIHVPIERIPHITEESFAIALGYLYASTSIGLVEHKNARAVLATACFLGGMDDLCQVAYNLCKESISSETVYEWLEWLGNVPFDTNGTNGHRSGAASPVGPNPNGILGASVNGTTLGGTSTGFPSPSPSPAPSLQHQHALHPHSNEMFFPGPPPPHLAHLHPHPHHLQQRYGYDGYGNPIPPPHSQQFPVPGSGSIFGPYEARLKADVFNFLVVSLPSQLLHGVPDTSSVTNGKGGEAQLADVYSKLPFDYFKAALESNEFPMRETQDRFRFAKSVIVVRKKGIARDAEETVVLAFGGGDGSAVHLTRRMKGGRRLLKVGGK